MAIRQVTIHVHSLIPRPVMDVDLVYQFETPVDADVLRYQNYLINYRHWQVTGVDL